MSKHWFVARTHEGELVKISDDYDSLYALYNDHEVVRCSREVAATHIIDGMDLKQMQTFVTDYEGMPHMESEVEKKVRKKQLLQNFEVITETIQTLI